MMQYQVKLDVFEGPFDLLLHLIHKHQVDIYDIPIAKIADEFVEYLQHAEFLDIEQAADFLLMAATLMQIKARMLVPRPTAETDQEESEDPRSELVERLIEYRSLKSAAAILSDRAEFWSHVFTREVDEVIPDSHEYVPDLGGVSAVALARAFLQVISRADEIGDADEPATIGRDEFTVASEVERLRLRLQCERRLSFFSLFRAGSSRQLVVTTFLAILELIKRGEVTASQPAPFCDIILTAVERQGGTLDGH